MVALRPGEPVTGAGANGSAATERDDAELLAGWVSARFVTIDGSQNTHRRWRRGDTSSREAQRSIVRRVVHRGAPGATVLLRGRSVL